MVGKDMKEENSYALLVGVSIDTNFAKLFGSVSHS